MIIDTSYFQYQPLRIPNAIPQISIQQNTPSNNDELLAAITNMEYQLLINALGYEQYNELMSQFEVNGDWKVSALQKWKDLIDGKDEWRGVRYSVGTYKHSLIAYYVYYQFLLNDQVYYTTTGLQRANSENSNTVIPNSQLTRIWNQFVIMYQGWYNYCGCSGWVQNDTAGNNLSMLGYMQSRPDDYGVDNFTLYELQNVWGI